MTRTLPLAVLLFSAVSTGAQAQDWAQKMFTVRSHDFGTIARAAKAEFAFDLTNLYLEDVHISSVRSSCHCTTPRIEKDTLKTYEKGAVIAHINSDRLLGHQSATLTVTIDKPQYAQVQLNVKVYIYSDVLLEPTSVAFGSIAEGTSVDRTICVRYTGHSDWQIQEVRSDNPHLTATVTERTRQGGRITYDLNAVLDDKSPTGYVNESLWLITNDARIKEIPVPVDGQVLASISVSPASLFLGVVEPGGRVTKQIVVRGQKPFRITAIHGDCECLQATVPKDEEAKTLYLIPVTFTAGEIAGKITQTVSIETDSGQAVLKVPAYSVVEVKQ